MIQAREIIVLECSFSSEQQREQVGELFGLRNNRCIERVIDFIVSSILIFIVVVIVIRFIVLFFFFSARGLLVVSEEDEVLRVIVANK
jgi:hypothetical protein